ncbi:MAG: XRE family transcriptional regulator [Desulfobacula sp.]|nr:XRE family transcriptional regulator [Desulfobacula sp.]
MDEKLICQNIKKLRKQNHLTLEKLAFKTGLTKGYLSKVERSQKAPPYSTLNKIAGALGIEVTQIFEKNIEPLDDIKISFHKANSLNIIKATSQFSGYDYQVLAPDKPGKNMEPFIIYSPDEITKMYSHEGEEFMYVMDGTLEFIYGKETYILEKGDHVYFDSCIPHAGKSLGEKKATLMVVIYFYKRNRR